MTNPATVTRRRGATLHRAILDAALVELASNGYAAFSMERVAARAATGKAALYRRWRNRDELILDCVRGGIPAGEQPHYTGDLRADLERLYRGMARGLHSPAGAAMRAVLLETHRRPELLAALHDAVFDPAAAALRTMLAEAAAAGEIDAGVVDTDLVTVGHEMLMFVHLTSGDTGADHARFVARDLMTRVLGLRGAPGVRGAPG